MANRIRENQICIILQLAMNGLNAALDFWFVLGMGWGVEGVAWATFIAEWFAFLWAWEYVSHYPKIFQNRLVFDIF